MVIPRENKLVRLYIQLKEIVPDATGRADKSKINPEVIFSAAQKIISPFKIDYEYCDWWTAYQVGRVTVALNSFFSLIRSSPDWAEVVHQL
jgi:phenol 2-monooxygenase (NADPH)